MTIAFRLGLLAASYAVCAVWASALAQEPAGIRFAHLSPDAPRVDVVVAGRPVLRDLGFGDVSGYVPVQTGDVAIDVYPHVPAPSADDEGEPEGSGGRRLRPVTRLAAFVEGGTYTVVFAGFFEPPPDEEQTGFLSVNVDPPDAQVRIRGPRGYEREEQGDVLVSDLAPGEYDIEVRADGFHTSRYVATVHSLRTTVVTATLQPVADDEEGAEDDAEDDGTAPEPQAVDRPAGPGAQDGESWHSAEILVFEDALELPRAGDARVQVVHAAPLAPPLDVVFVASSDGGEGELQRLAEDVAYGEPAVAGSVRAGAGRLSLLVAGTATDAIAFEPFRLAPGTTYTLFVVSGAEQEPVRLLPTVVAAVRSER